MMINILQKPRQKIYPLFILFCLFCISFLCHSARAAWSLTPRENTAICRAVGQQSGLQMVGDGAGGAIVVWEDARESHFDIYAQRIDAHGDVLWMEDGVPICTAPENQNKPRIVSDGEGGAIITWQDIRKAGGNYDIYVQRVNAKGEVLWASNGVPVCTVDNTQNTPCIATDGAGGAIIVWQDYRTNYADLFAQRVNKHGELLWVENGIPVCLTSGAQSAPVMVEDGTGGAIVAWQDFRRNYADIYAQRIDGSGNRLWDILGIPVCAALGHENLPALIGNKAEGAIVVWVDTRNGNNDIFAQQVDGSGGVQWLENGIPVCAVAGNQNNPVITSDGAGGALIAWWDMRSGESDIYAQSVDLAGNVQWGNDGLAVCVEMGIQNHVGITNDGAGGMVLAWGDNRTSAFDLFAQRIDRKGIALWEKNGLTISTALNTQCFPVLLGDGTGGAMVIWQDDRQKEKTYWDVYAQRINGQGSLGEK